MSTGSTIVQIVLTVLSMIPYVIGMASIFTSAHTQSFEEENEVRIVFSAEETDLRINFRVKSNMLIPYVEISFDPKAITSLYVGPVQNQNMTEQSVITFRNNVAERLIRKEKTDIERSHHAP